MPEVRLIDKQKAQTEIALIAKHFARSDAQKSLIGRILFMLDQMPTIEPEVRHGRWLPCLMLKFRYECGCCGEPSNYPPPYCPKCGARMDATDTNVGDKGGADNG